MDFGQTQLGTLISGTQQEEKAKYHVVGSRVRQACNLVRKMYGKSSHVKLIENGYGQVMMSGQAGVVYDNMKMNHPLVKLLHEYVKKMEAIGDGATFFVMVVSGLISETLSVVDRGIKPALLAESFRGVERKMEGLCLGLRMDHDVDFGDEESVRKVIRGVVQDRSLEDVVVGGICQAGSVSVEKIRICKVGSGSTEDSYVVEGMVFTRWAEGHVREASRARTSIYNCPVDIARTELKGTVVLKTGSELEQFSKEENKGIRKAVSEVSADVVICSGKVERIYLDFLNKAGKLVFRVVSKHDLRRIRELVGGEIWSTFRPQGEESQGFVDSVATFSEGGVRYTRFISHSKKIHTIVLKNSVAAKLDEQERVVEKTLRVLEKNMRQQRIEIVEGAGRFERRVSEILLARSKELRDEESIAYKCMGRTLGTFCVEESEIYDVYNTKMKALKYAVEFIVTLLETSDYLVGKPEPLSIAPRTNQQWDEDH